MRLAISSEIIDPTLPQTSMELAETVAYNRCQLETGEELFKSRQRAIREAFYSAKRGQYEHMEAFLKEAEIYSSQIAMPSDSVARKIRGIYQRKLE